MNKQEFLKTVSELVMAENKKRGYPLYSSVVIAQAICETGWGSSSLMMKANAIFGIKAGGSWKGKVYNAKTKECYDGKNYTNITANFRAYDSLADSVSDYFDLITKSERYRKACVAESPEACIQAIKNGGYATSPTYVGTIMLIIMSQNLTKYDKQEKEEKPKKEEKKDNKFIVGNTYKTLVNLNVRTGAGTNYDKKGYYDLTVDGRKHALKSGVLKKNTKVTCKDVIAKDNEIWLKIPSGFICAYYKGKEYIK